MLTGLDHIIIGVNNLEQATHIFSEKLGLAVSGGGTHPTGGTANRIIVIGDTYLELITVRDPSEAQHSMLTRLAKGEGYLNFALVSDDIMRDSAEMQRRGVKIVGPKAGALTSADERTRRWSRTDVERPDLTQHYPFLIQHDSSGTERRLRLAGWKTPPEHPLGATSLLSATIAVADLDEATTRFQHIYGLQASDSFSGAVDAWDAMRVSFLLHSALQSFELATPLPMILDPTDDTQHLPEPDAFAAYLQRFGEGLCRITLSVDSLEHARDYLDEHEVVYTYREKPHSVLWIHPDEACGAALVLHEFTSEIPPSLPLDYADSNL